MDHKGETRPQGQPEINLSYIGATEEHPNVYDELSVARSGTTKSFDNIEYQTHNGRSITLGSEVTVTRMMIVLVVIGSLLLSILISVITGIIVYNVTVSKVTGSNLQDQDGTTVSPANTLALKVTQLENNLTTSSDDWKDEMNLLKNTLLKLTSNLITTSDDWNDEVNSLKNSFIKLIDNLTTQSDVLSDEMTSLKVNVTTTSDMMSGIDNELTSLKKNLTKASAVWSEEMTSLKKNITTTSEVWNEEMMSLQNNLTTTSDVLSVEMASIKNNLTIKSDALSEEMTSLKNTLAIQSDAFSEEVTSLKNNQVELKNNLTAAVGVWNHQMASLKRNNSVSSLYSKDCSELYATGTVEDGVYAISPDGRCPFHVYCDMTGGGWTLIQTRIDGLVSFYRSWNEYAKGFGNIDGEHWLGLDKIHRLTSDGSEIYFQFGYYDGKTGFAHYQSFSVQDASTYYRMTVESIGYNGTIKELFSYQNNMKFSTYDRDNDYDSGNCAKSNDGGGWWYNACSRLGNLNGVYGKRERGGIAYWDGSTMVPLKTVSVKVKLHTGCT